MFDDEDYEDDLTLDDTDYKISDKNKEILKQFTLLVFSCFLQFLLTYIAVLFAIKNIH